MTSSTKLLFLSVLLTHLAPVFFFVLVMLAAALPILLVSSS